MKILYINPPKYDKKLYTLRDEICFQDVKYVPLPIRLAQLAGITLQIPGTHNKIIDCNALNISWKKLAQILARDIDYDLVIFQTAAGLIKYDYQTAQLVKKNNKKTKVAVIETIAAPIYTKRFLQDFPAIDIVFMGQPEAIIENLVNVLKKDRLNKVNGIAYRAGPSIKINPYQPPIYDLNKLPFMAYELLPMRKYSVNILAKAMLEKKYKGICLRSSRDCPFGCPFCVIGSDPRRGYDRKLKLMSPKRFVDELAYLNKNYGLSHFFIWDETFTIQQKRAAQICEEIISRKLRITWRCLTRIDCLSPELLKKMRRAGCRHIEFGLESGDPEVRKYLHKNFDNALVKKIVSACKKNCINVTLDVIVGMTYESKSSLANTQCLIKEVDADMIHITTAFPYPATKYLADLKALRLKTYFSNDLYDLIVNNRVRVGAKPYADSKYLTAEDIIAGWRELRREASMNLLYNKILKQPWHWPLYLRYKSFGALCRGLGLFFRLFVRKNKK